MILLRTFPAAILLLFAACISSEESGSSRQEPITSEPAATQSSEQKTQTAPETASKPQGGSRQTNTSRLTSKRDTVMASVTTRTRSAAKRPIVKPKDPAYTVQVGAFGKAQNALQYLKLAKERFPKNSVHNNYDSKTKIYRVSVGKFTTKKEAVDLRRTIMQKFPKDYTEAWVNYIAK